MSLTILRLDFRKQAPSPSLPRQWVRRGRSAPNLSLKLLRSCTSWCCQCFLSSRIKERARTQRASHWLILKVPTCSRFRASRVFPV